MITITLETRTAFYHYLELVGTPSEYEGSTASIKDWIAGPNCHWLGLDRIYISGYAAKKLIPLVESFNKIWLNIE